MSRRFVVPLLLGCLLFARPSAFAAGTETELRKREVAAGIMALQKELQNAARQVKDSAKANDWERSRRQPQMAVLLGQLEEARAELALLKKVTAKAIPADVAREIAIAKLAIRCQAAQGPIELLEQAIKRHPDPDLARALLEARFAHTLPRAEHDLLKKSAAAPDSKEFRLEFLQVKAKALGAHIRAPGTSTGALNSPGNLDTYFKGIGHPA